MTNLLFHLVLLLAAALSVGAQVTCGGALVRLDPAAPRCPPRMDACGSGCIELGKSCCGGGEAVCGSSGGGSLSGESCQPNTGNTCTFSGGASPSKYCCGEGETVAGSQDIPDDVTFDGDPGVFCGNTVIRAGEPCCNSVGECGVTGIPGGSSSSGGGGGGGSVNVGDGSCSSNSDCSAFGARHCSGSANTRCGTDNLCRCCRNLCTGNTCRCTDCAGCEGSLEMCLQSVCVFRMGGKTTD
ncbi:MAG: hypothetical protein ACOZIN_04455 [Myxococcota bacterium]